MIQWHVSTFCNSRWIAIWANVENFQQRRSCVLCGLQKSPCLDRGKASTGCSIHEATHGLVASARSITSCDVANNEISPPKDGGWSQGVAARDSWGHIFIYIYIYNIYIMTTIDYLVVSTWFNPWKRIIHSSLGIIIPDLHRFAGAAGDARPPSSIAKRGVFWAQWSLDWFKGKSTGNHCFYHQI